MLRRAVSTLIERLPERLSASIKANHYARLLSHDLADRDLDLRAAALLVRVGETALDVGANVGVWTHYLSAIVGPTGRVWAFEPVPQTFALLRSNVERFRLGNVIVVNRAVSDKEMVVSMSVPKDSRGIRNYHLARIGSADGPHSFQVLSVPLDSWFLEAGEPRVTFVKIDTEGHELACIRGMSLLVVRCFPSLCVEVSSDLDDPSSDGARIVRELKRHDYKTYIWTGAAFRPRRRGERTTNYFFLRSEHLPSGSGVVGP